MNHQLEIKEYKRLPEGQVSVAACCCGDPVHTSWHTMGPAVVGDPSRFEASVNWHVQRVANQHESMLQAQATLSTFLGQTHVFDSHSVKFDHFIQLSDGQLSIGSVCCGDESTLSSHIVDANVAADPIICQATLKNHFQQAAAQHENMKRCHAALPGLVGREFKIDTTAKAPVIAAPHQSEAAA